jgi:hypothetical protein
VIVIGRSGSFVVARRFLTQEVWPSIRVPAEGRVEWGLFHP